LISLLSKLFLVGVAAAAVAIPSLEHRVTDLTNTLNQAQTNALEQTLAEFETRKGAQIAVLIVPSTQPETIEQYAVRVEEQWKLGRKGVDDSVLLVVALQDRKIRLEVGYGLEGVLPDAAAKRIIEDDLTPRFRKGDFYGGIRAGLDRVMRTVEGEALPPPAARATPAQRHGIEEWVAPLFFFFIIGGGILKSLFGRFFGGGLIGAALGVAAWLFVGSLAIALLVGFAAFVLALLTGMPGSRGGWGSSGWGGGGWSSGGGGFSSGGGGFSGGGGSSGGGGASGSW
jgi:uncharacterized protein